MLAFAKQEKSGLEIFKEDENFCQTYF
jgi:hypothetical protein